MDVEGMEAYKPPPEFEEDTNDPLIDLNLTDSMELWLIQLPFGKDLLKDIEGKELSLKLHGDGQLSSFEGSSGKVYDFINFDTQEADEIVFVSSASKEPKIAGKISRRVSVVHYPDPEELEKANSNNPRQNSSGTMMTTSSQCFPVQSGRQSSRSGRAASTQGSRPRSSVSEVSEPSNTPKRRRTAESDLSRGHSSGISSASSDQSPGGKSKRRSKHEE